MANSGAIKAGRAFVELFADDSKLMRTLRSQEQKWKSVGKSVAGYGAMISGAALPFVGIFAAATKSFMTAGDQLNKMAARTGFAVEALSELGFAAEQSGADIELLETGLRGMQKFTLNASRELSTAIDTLDELGLTAKDLKGLAPDEIFELLAEAISRVSDPTKQAALSMQVFGRAGSKLLPLLQGGAAGIKALRDQAGDLGLTVTKEDADNAAALTDAYNELTRSIKGGFLKVGAAIAPMLERVADSISPITSFISKWIDRNRGLFRSVFQVSAAIAGVGSMLIGLGGAISLVGFAFGGLATILSAIGPIAAATFAAITSPVGLAIAAVGGLVYAFHDLLTETQWFKDFAASWSETMGAIVTAIKSGNIGKAWDVLIAGLKVEWVGFTDWLGGHIDSAWKDIVESLPEEWADAMRSMAKMVDALVVKLENLRLGAVTDIAEQIIRLDGKIRGLSDKAIEATIKENRRIGRINQNRLNDDAEFQTQVQDALNGFLAGPEEQKGKSDELIAAEQALANAIEEAKKPPKDAPGNQDQAAEKTAADIALETARQNAAITRATEKGQTREQNTAVGSFSSFRVGASLGTSPLNSISKNTRDTAKYTKQIAGQKGATFT